MNAAPDFPTKPIRLLTSGAGGTGDTAARVIAPSLSSRLGQPVVVENHPDGISHAQILLGAPPDGHTLMLVGGVIWLAPFMLDAVPYDPLRDLAPITLAVASPNVLVVPLSLPVETVEDLLRLARQKPGTLTMAITGEGNSNQLATEIFKAMAGVDIVGVRYKGAKPAVADVIDGRVSMLFVSVNSSRAHIAAGRMRAIAVSSAQPTPLMPGVPTIASGGLPGYSSTTTLGLMARADTPPALLDLLYREVAQILKLPETRQRLLDLGVDVIASTPQEFAAYIKDEMDVKGKIIRSVGIRMG